MKVMSKIAFKEWNERKKEEERLDRKRDRMERRQRMLEMSEEKESRSKRGEVLLAYGLNKNLKYLRGRPKSARPKKAKKKAKKQLQYS